MEKLQNLQELKLIELKEELHRKLLKKLRKVARQRGEHLEFIKKHGKGSHGTICLGERCTTMKDRKKEIGKGLLNAMLEQLGVDKDEL